MESSVFPECIRNNRRSWTLHRSGNVLIAGFLSLLFRGDIFCDTNSQISSNVHAFRTHQALPLSSSPVSRDNNGTIAFTSGFSQYEFLNDSGLIDITVAHKATTDSSGKLTVRNCVLPAATVDCSVIV